MIRLAMQQDCESLAALSIKVWLDTYAKEGIRPEYANYALSTFTSAYFSGLLETPDYRLLVSTDGEFIQGYALTNFGSHYQSPENGFEVEKLYVDNCFQGQGIGKKLLAEVTKQFGQRFWLYTWVENASNDFYQKLGFRQVGKLTFDFAQWTIENNVWLSPDF